MLPFISVEHHHTWLHFSVDTSYIPLWLILTYVPQESVHNVSLHFYRLWGPALRKNSINTGWTIEKANQPWALTSLCSLSACTSFSCPRSFSCSRVRAFTVSLTLWVGDRCQITDWSPEKEWRTQTSVLSSPTGAPLGPDLHFSVGCSNSQTEF